MYQALYRAYRPETFAEVLGQEHIVRILKNQIAAESTSHAYLFCGTRGTGKTTTARLLAKGLNCLSDGDRPCGECANCRAIKEGSFIDVIEIDAASNNGVDNIRELRESVNYPPAVGRKKVYIIDEVHMLSTGAFNALLKTLEEPPEYVTFILATTEVQKLPATIMSRCMRLDFKRVPEKTLMNGMADICGKIGVDVSEDALRIIAANADGSVRDGLSILDQCISGGGRSVSGEDVLEFLGASGAEDFIELTEMIRKRRTSEAIVFLAEILSDGKDARQFMRDWVSHYRNLLMVKFVKEPSSVVSMSSENIERVSRQADALDLEDINRGILELSKTISEARWSTQPRILLELTIVKLCMGAKNPGPLPARKEKEVVPGLSGDGGKSGELKKKKMSDMIGSSEKKEVEPAAEPLAAGSVNRETEVDLQEIWNMVFEDGESRKGSFYIIRSNGVLASIDEEEFTVIVTNVLTRDYAENNRELLENLMEKHTGRRRRMKITMETPGGGEEKSAREIAEDAEQILGIKIDVE